MDEVAALAILECNGADVSLLLTDIVMPGMGGRQLAAKVREIDPTIAVLFTTGYATDKVQEGIEEGDLLRKPYAPRDLLTRVRQALDGTNTPVLPTRTVGQQRGECLDRWIRGPARSFCRGETSRC